MKENLIFNKSDLKENANNTTKDVVPTKDLKINIAPHSHFGHRERLRGIINNTDILSLPEHQILELMLTFVLPQRDVNPLAHDILNEFGSLANVFEASVESLTKVKGVGQVTANFLSFCSKIPEIYKNSKANAKVRLNNVADIIKYLKASIDFTSVEKFYYVCLNGKGDVLCFKNMGSGSISQLYINNREFVQQILRYPTQAVVICHTHPHGEPQPSEEDIMFTKTLVEMLRTLNIHLCDHVILSPDGHYSFFQHRIVGDARDNDNFSSLKMSLLSNEKFKLKDEDTKLVFKVENNIKK